MNHLQTNSINDLSNDIDYTEEDILKGLKKLTVKIEKQLMQQGDFMNLRAQNLMRLYFSCIREIRNSMAIISAAKFRKKKEAEEEKKTNSETTGNLSNNSDYLVNKKHENYDAGQNQSNKQKQNTIHLGYR